MGGFATGLAQAGLEILWASDNDIHACSAFQHRFPNVPMINKDVRQLSVEENRLTPVDVLAAGFPCQSFSQAGSRKGFQDPRGALFFEIPRLIQEFPEEDRPALVVLENVPHLLYGANGCWFDQIRRAMRQAGYWFREETCWTVNVKDVTDSPQDRERLFMVAAARRHFSRNPFSADNLVKAPTRHRRSLDEFIDRTQQAEMEAYLPPDNRYYKMIDKAMGAGESASNIYQLRRSYVREKKQGLCPTLTANMGVGGHNVPFVRDSWGIRRLSVSEVAALQGFNVAGGLFPNIPVAEQYRLLGNAVCVDLAHLIGNACANILIGQANAN
ncbi:MAG: DNA (cytosine-5-)-methyltransferase [Rhodospirillales bacterium]|nr:DNA (cytosine-5-)-methyltransferase [Rhodospirillales bacterium]